MAKIINSIEGQRLYELDVFHQMLSDDYLTNKDNIQTKFIFEQFFKNNAKLADERLALLNVSYSIPSLIVEKFSDYVGEPKTTLGFEIDSYVSAFIWGGVSVFRPKVVDGIFYIDYCSPDEYVVDDDGGERLFFYYDIVTSAGAGGSDQTTTYILQERYFENTVERTLFKVTKKQKYKEYSVEGTPVPLNSIYATLDLKEFESFPEVKDKNGVLIAPLVKVHNRKLKTIKYGTSEIRKVRSLISSIEVEAVNIQDQFLKHLQAKLAVPKSGMKVEKDGTVNVRDMEVFGMETGDTLPAYIMNSNPLIDKSFQQIEDYVRQIAAILTLPTEFFGLKDAGGAESAETKKIRLVSFVKKIEKIRKKFEDALKKLNEIKKAWSTEKADDELIIAWPSIFPDNGMELATELSTAQDSKLISNKKAIMRYQGIDESSAEEEQKIINEENANVQPAELGI